MLYFGRYEGEKEVETKNEKKHLSELLKRIKERKQQRAAKNESSVSREHKDVKESDPKKRKRKKEIVNECLVQDTSVDSNVIESNIETRNADQGRLHKKKKRKKKDIQNVENNGESETIEAKDKVVQDGSADNQEKGISNKLVNSNNLQEQIPEKPSDFLVLGAKPKRKIREVKRVLPEWLASPQVISIDLNSGPSIEELNSVLDSKLVEALKANGISKLFPVQASMISWLLKGNLDRQQGWWLRDTCVSAPTGSGMHILGIH